MSVESLRTDAKRLAALTHLAAIADLFPDSYVSLDVKQRGGPDISLTTNDLKGDEDENPPASLDAPDTSGDCRCGAVCVRPAPGG